MPSIKLASGKLSDSYLQEHVIVGGMVVGRGEYIEWRQRRGEAIGEDAQETIRSIDLFFRFCKKAKPEDIARFLPWVPGLLDECIGV